MGSNIATINGRSYDIAAFSGGASGPDGSVIPLNIDGRLFVPMRFLANAFVMPVGWLGGGTVTLG